MSSTPVARAWTLDQYLDWEERQPVKHELIDGQPRMMVGSRIAHQKIETNIVAALHPRLRGSGCRVFGDATKLKAPNGNVYYPDAMVACGARGDQDRWIEDPVVLVEVISPGSEADDRGHKLLAYQVISSLPAYLIVAQAERRVDVYRRDDEGRWRHEIVTSGSINLPVGTVAVSLDEIYEDVAAVPPSAAAGA
ncbi:MAG: Uma2 family endonuclease [Alphaproteobacteria bacterium]|nr:Uma2 family endonuclease [Alphaproteobacteria bacterium]